MIKKEWKNLFQNKLLLMVLCAIALIPTIYAGLFLASMWDPYGNVDHLPVAVVNEDAAVSYNNSQLQIGNNLVENLKKNNALLFDFVDANVAKEGLKNGTYYMVITIPKDFSKNASTLMNQTPQKMVLHYDTNPGTNYIASKLSETARSKIRSSVSEEVTKTYTQTVFEEIAQVGDGMQTASNGATQIRNGFESAQSGN